MSYQMKGGGGKDHFKGRGVYQKLLMRAKMQIICFTSDCYYTNRNIFIAFVHGEKGRGEGGKGAYYRGGEGGGQKLQIMEGVTLGEWSSKGY